MGLLTTIETTVTDTALRLAVLAADRGDLRTAQMACERGLLAAPNNTLAGQRQVSLRPRPPASTTACR